MNKFSCTTCGAVHPLVTLLEFPQPGIISDISSGKVKQSLHVIEKNVFLIGKERFVVLVELQLNIVDYEDELDILIWADFDAKKFYKKFKKLDPESNYPFIIDARLLQEIPFYKNTLHSKIKLVLQFDRRGFIVKSVVKKGQLFRDFEKGIKLIDLTNILEELYHVE